MSLNGDSCHYQDDNYDYNLRFNTKFVILQFDRRVEADKSLDWLNMVEQVFEYYDSLEVQKCQVFGYQDVLECFDLVEKLEDAGWKR